MKIEQLKYEMYSETSPLIFFKSKMIKYQRRVTSIIEVTSKGTSIHEVTSIFDMPYFSLFIVSFLSSEKGQNRTKQSEN